ncbi:Zn-ribbon domain-containing OB-fold protein [Haloglomus litoreum]|uniref:Zn-ribbon domain-containing OB-fold protein n=1 Tax=Haloglomus litoreum TaxID=3034026 RepID=UPI0023E86C6C|nr:OB-fold domain-containing protein [Haloglomus sp. DT116]
MSDDFTPENPAPDGEYDAWLDAVDAGDGYHLVCDEGHGWLPPRRVCPRCGGDLREEPLPDSGAVATFTVVHVPTPSFAAEAPYATVVADFGGVRLTGVARQFEDLAVGDSVAPAVGEREDGERLLLLERA